MIFSRFRPVFPWSFAKHDPERWFIRQNLRKLLENDIYYGSPLDGDEARRLEELTRHVDWLIRFGAKTALHFSGRSMESDPEFHKWMIRYMELYRPKRVPASSIERAKPYLFQRYAFYATPFKDALERLLREAMEISRSVNRPVILFGGVTKGTATPTSDLDFAVVSREPLRIESHQHVPVITPRSTDPDSLSILFSGNAIFTGGRRLVRDVQRSILEHVSEERWERGRKHAAQQEGKIHHVTSIYGIDPNRAPLVAALRAVDRVPPRLDTARRILHV